MFFANKLLTMATPHAEKSHADALTESLLNDEAEEQAILDEELPQTLHIGEKQPTQFRDVPFAILFVIQLVVVLSLAIFWGFPALRYGPPEDGNTGDVEFSGILYICLISGVAAAAISALALGFMTRYAHFLVQFSVLFSMFSSLFMVIVFGFQDNDGAALMAFIFFAISAWFAWAIWHRIPFASSNLVTALTAVRANLGVALVAYGMVLAAAVWSLLWMTSLIGVYSRYATCIDGECQGSVPGGEMILFLLSFYWTHQVFKNLIRVVVAGVVGTWWFDPAEASSLCSRAIMDSLVRSLTYSFGSICFGSLLVAAIQVCRTLVENARRQGNNGIVMCILDCLLGCIERLVDYFNKWNYVYVGLYGYSYTEAGHKVMSLFAQRGWTTIINDDLVTNVLSLMSLVIGCLTGCVGLALAAAHKSWVSEFPEEQSLSVPFLSAFLIGVLIASILVSPCSKTSTVAASYCSLIVSLHR